MKRCSCLLVIAWLCSACDPGGSKGDAPSKAAPEATKAAPEATKAAPGPTKAAHETTAEAKGGAAAVPTEPGPRAEGERWRTTLAEAKAAGLPPLAFSFTMPPAAGMIGSRFGNGDYVTLSGPPGGTLMLRITPATVGADPAGLVDRQGSTTVPQEVELLGAKQPAVAWVHGESMARTSWCGVILAPTGAIAGAPALLLELGIGHYEGEASCTPTIEDDALGVMAKSLVFE